MATGRSGSSVKTRLGFHLYGDYGTWKSSFCLESMKLVNDDGTPFKVLYIDPENGSIDTYLDEYEENGYNLKNIYVLYTQSISEVKEYIRKVRDNEDLYELDEDGEETDEIVLDADGKPFRADMIVVDGLSLLYTAKQQSLIEFSKKRATVRANKNELTGMAKEVAIEGSSLELKDWSVIKTDGQALILDLLACGKHFAVTSREKAETDQMRDKDGSIKSVRTGRYIADSFKDVSYNCKTVIRMFKDDDGIIKGLVDNKDRTKVHQQNEVLIEPSILDWQAVITKGKNKADYTVRNNMNKAVEAELAAVEKDNAKYDNEFESKETAKSNNATMTKEDYCEAIKKAIASLAPTEKAKRQTEIASAGLPKAYQKLDSVDDLRKYLSIVSK